MSSGRGKWLTVLTIDSYNRGIEIFLHRTLEGTIRNLKTRVKLTVEEIDQLKNVGYLDSVKSDVDPEGRPTVIALYRKYPIGE